MSAEPRDSTPCPGCGTTGIGHTRGCSYLASLFRGGPTTVPTLDLDAAEATLGSTFYEDRGNVEELVAALNAQARALVDAAVREEREKGETLCTGQCLAAYEAGHRKAKSEYAPLLAAATEYASAARAASLVEAHHGAPEGQRLWAATEKLYLAALALPLPEAPND